MGQKPISFFRQVFEIYNIKVSSLIENPDLLKPQVRSIVSQLYPADTVARAVSLLADMGGSSGAYSHSQGIPTIRKHVAQMIHGKLNVFLKIERDGFPADPNDIFLTAGYFILLCDVIELVQLFNIFYKLLFLGQMLE